QLNLPMQEQREGARLLLNLSDTTVSAPHSAVSGGSSNFRTADRQVVGGHRCHLLARDRILGCDITLARIRPLGARSDAMGGRLSTCCPISKKAETNTRGANEWHEDSGRAGSQAKLGGSVPVLSLDQPVRRPRHKIYWKRTV